MSVERLPHETAWNLSAKPFALESKQNLRCIFCGGEMIISHGQVITFELGVHGDAEKWSHACDVWMRCYDCNWSVVHGVAIPERVYLDFANMSLGAQRVDEKGKEISPEQIAARDKLGEERRKDNLAGKYGPVVKRRAKKRMKRMKKQEKMIEAIKAAQLEKRGGQELKLSKEKKAIPEGMAVTIFPFKESKTDKRKPEPRWMEVYSEKGLNPIFPMTCKMCGRVGEMFLRHSRMHLVRQDRLLKRLKIPFFKRFEMRLFKSMSKETSAPVFRVSYKCPYCDWLATFVVPVRKDHFDKILELRKNKPLYYPPLEDWKSEDELIKKKLESLGYV